MTVRSVTASPRTPAVSAETFAPSAPSAGRARRFVRAVLAAYRLNSEATELVVSELMANVVQHAQTEVEVRVVVGAVIRVEVHDGNGIAPAVVDAAADAEHGRGLFIVEALAQRWRIERTAGGKCVWVELPRIDG